MYSYFKIKVKIFFIVFVVLIWNSCNPFNDNVYEVIFSGLPKKISVSQAQINIVCYILKQTHEPLFRKDDGENYTSRILKYWERDIKSTQFVFCPDTSKKFNDEHNFTLSFFEKYIKRTTLKYVKDFHISKNNGCFIVKFKKSQKKYLDFLTLYENAPTLKRTEDIEDGLGEFYFSEKGKNKIILRRKFRINNGYNKIIIYKYKGENVPNLENKKIEDFNLIYSSRIPKWAKRNYASFNILEPKNVVLLLNHPNRKMRTMLYNCIDIDKLRKAYYPNKKNFYDIQTILPLGIMEAKSGKPKQICRIVNGCAKKFPLIFANWKKDNRILLSNYFDEFYRDTGVKVKIENYTIQELSNVLIKGKRKNYNLMIVVIDASGRNDPMAFFEIFINRTFFDFRIPEIERLYNLFTSEPNHKKRKMYLLKIMKIVEREHLVLPLYQSIHKFYYPPHIKNIIVGRDFLQYPEVAEFRW